ncbi:ABC transporter substrate-binding protein [Bradyrhizobium viridifuturi]|uniref:ABC transporter substrate-binding protein n=1 Tax=Bradyrhizobium viridifuturi TaxID=1654716 RepID=UPI00067EB416|nr:ABC transporter substrate-binding protein [Bradyrhizobium viridifuturi]
MKTVFSLIIVAAALVNNSASAQYTDNTIKIGILTDMSGIYSDIGGPGSLVAAKIAVEDFGAAAKGMKVEVVGADMQNKPDIGASIATRWFDVEQVDVIVDGMNSGVSLAVSEIARQKNKLFLVTGAATSDLTGPKCNANTIHWVYDTWALANSTGKATVQTGGDTWFFVTADYAFGYALERDAGAVVEANGGKVLGKVRVPINTSDFSSFLLQAQASKAKVVGLANAGGDATNAIKQAAEFGIVKGGQNIAGLLLWVSDVAALGLPITQGVVLTEAWYWDLNDNNRAWTKRWQVERPGKIPTSAHAGVYSAVTHYLKAVEALKSDADGRAVASKMKEIPTDDRLYGKGKIRADGRKIHDMYLFEVKTPAESRYFGDFYKLRATIPAPEAFRPLKDGGCPLVND